MCLRLIAGIGARSVGDSHHLPNHLAIVVFSYQISWRNIDGVTLAGALNTDEVRCPTRLYIGNVHDTDAERRLRSPQLLQTSPEQNKAQITNEANFTA